jgi:hypothetical protein
MADSHTLPKHGQVPKIEEKAETMPMSPTDTHSFVSHKPLGCSCRNRCWACCAIPLYHAEELAKRVNFGLEAGREGEKLQIDSDISMCRR